MKSLTIFIRIKKAFVRFVKNQCDTMRAFLSTIDHTTTNGAEKDFRDSCIVYLIFGLFIIIVILLCSFVTLLILFFMSPQAMNNRKLYSSYGELKELLSSVKIPELSESHWSQLKDIAKNVTKHMLIEGEYKGENFQKKVIQDTKNILSPLNMSIEEKYAKGRADLVFRSDIFTIVIEVKAKDVGRIQKNEFQKVEEYIVHLEADLGIIVVLFSLANNIICLISSLVLGLITAIGVSLYIDASVAY